MSKVFTKIKFSKGEVRFDDDMRPLIEDLCKCCGVSTLEELLGSSKEDNKYIVFDGYLDELVWNCVLNSKFTEQDIEEYDSARNMVFNPYFQLLCKFKNK